MSNYRYCVPPRGFGNQILHDPLINLLFKLATLFFTYESLFNMSKKASTLIFFYLKGHL